VVVVVGFVPFVCAGVCASQVPEQIRVARGCTVCVQRATRPSRATVQTSPQVPSSVAVGATNAQPCYGSRIRTVGKRVQKDWGSAKDIIFKAMLGESVCSRCFYLHGSVRF
jgi:hypothetical protein